MRYARTAVLALFAIVVVSCESSVEPRDDITLLVMNGTCDPGPCASQRVLAFPSNQPTTPGGWWKIDLGVMDGPSLCVTLPASSTFSVVGPEKTTTFKWTTAIPVSLGLEAVVSPQLFPSPITDAFTPMSGNGWTTTLPTQTTVVRTNACANQDSSPR